jgi:hypothetical protein
MARNQTKADEPVAEKPAKTPREKIVREDGPATTTTGAPALVVEGRTFTAGGGKGEAIAHLLKTRPDMSNKDIAATVGCSNSRVSEVARVLGLQRKQRKPEPATA